MIRPTRIILTASLSLIMSALTVHTTQAQAARTQAAPPTRITTSEDITVPGNYILVNDIAGPGGDGLEIDASNVTVNLNGHTVSGSDGIGIEGENVNVYNGQAVGDVVGVQITGSYCLVHNLKITVAAGGIPVVIEYSNYNRVHNCVLSVAAGQKGQAAFHLFFTSYNSIQDNTILGVYSDTIIEDDQKNLDVTVAGDNTFSGNKFANPNY